MKLQFDLAKSLELCPPETYYSQFDGVKFIKRISINRDLVTFPEDENIRELDASEDRVFELESSYLQFGFVHSKAPQAVEIDPNDKRRFVGRAGFGRNKAQESIGYETFLYDVIEFENDKARIEFMYNSNDTEDHIPAFKNSETTIIKGVVNAVNEKVIPDTDSAILQFLGKIAKSKSVKKHESLLKKIRREHISAWPSMKAWNTSDANTWANDNNMPYEGDKSKIATALGYVRRISSWKNLFWDSLIKSKENSWASVFFSSWLDEPKPTALKEQRAKVVNDFNKMKETIDSWVCHYTGMTKDDLKKASKGKFPLIFNGFLPQNTAKNPKDNGNPMEKGLVDKDGNEWTRLDK